MQFELFERKARPTTTVPVIGVQARGTMSLNAVAFEMLMSTARTADESHTSAKPSGKQTAKTPDGADAMVEFLYAKADGVVGIRLAAENSMNAYPVRKQHGAETYIVTAKAFLGFHQIMSADLRRYVPKVQDGMLIFSLKEAVQQP